MPPTSELLRDLIRWVHGLRRYAVCVGFVLLVIQVLVIPGAINWKPLLAVIALATVYTELGRWLVDRVPARHLETFANVETVLDLLTSLAVVHFGGGLTSPSVGVISVPLIAAGILLPGRQTALHVVGATAALFALALTEQRGWLAHLDVGFFAADAHRRPDFIALVVTSVAGLAAMVGYISHRLTQMLLEKEEEARALATERGTLLAEKQREADRVQSLLASNDQVYARVRALLDVAQHVSGSHTVDELLHAVCDTTVALVRVPRVEIFMWERRRKILRLSAARGLARGTAIDEDRQYTADVPIVAQLRKGEVVDFGAAPSQQLAPSRMATPFRRGFAAPMVCRGSFEGALFVGYDDQASDDLKELVQGIARQAAVALVNVRALEEQQEDAEVSRGLLGVSQALSACLDEEALWTLLARGACQTLELPWAAASRFDEGSGSFRVVATAGVPDDVATRMRQNRFSLEDYPVVQELLSRREVIFSDDASRPAFPLPVDFSVGSWMALPLNRAGWVAGFLVVGTTGAARAFTRRQVRLAEGIGNHASTALHNAGLVSRLEQADRLKSEFVSAMSHELRTPLNVIIGYTEMLRDGAVGPVTPQQLDVIQRLDARGRELLELIEQTLHAARIEAGRDVAELQAMRLVDLVTALQTSTSGLPRPPGVTVEWEYPKEAPGAIQTDKAKLSLVVRNLVSNALKFTSEGGVLVRVTPRGDALVVEVRDTGVGISAEHLPIIFDMFRQVDGSMTRRHGGVGLGLYIVKQFTARLGGTVDVTSTPGEGSTFRVVLPGAVGAAAPRDKPQIQIRAA
jgi:signal transduction histidine kinase